MKTGTNDHHHHTATPAMTTRTSTKATTELPQPHGDRQRHHTTNTAAAAGHNEEDNEDRRIQRRTTRDKKKGLRDGQQQEDDDDDRDKVNENQDQDQDDRDSRRIYVSTLEPRVFSFSSFFYISTNFFFLQIDYTMNDDTVLSLPVAGHEQTKNNTIRGFIEQLTQDSMRNCVNTIGGARYGLYGSGLA
jgi:hypothetical protein